jgi:hypothetical protein
MHATEDLYIEGPIVLPIIGSFISCDCAVIPVYKLNRRMQKNAMQATEVLSKPEGCKPHVLMKKAYWQMHRYTL